MLPAVQRGILGGTFDPPHIAHLLAGEAAYRDLHLDRVDFVPAGAPWQKSGHAVSQPEHRWQMTLLAVAGVEYFAADDREVRRPGWTYTIETLESLPVGDDVTLVLGADAALGLPSWHRAADVLARARIAVLPRPGVAAAAVEAAVEAPVTWLDAPAIGVSGTMIRARVAAGRSVRFLVPEAVRDYLADHSLYQEG